MHLNNRILKLFWYSMMNFQSKYLLMISSSRCRDAEAALICGNILTFSSHDSNQLLQWNKNNGWILEKGKRHSKSKKTSNLHWLTIKGDPPRSRRSLVFSVWCLRLRSLCKSCNSSLWIIFSLSCKLYSRESEHLQAVVNHRLNNTSS